MMQVAATILVVLGMFSKFSAFFVTMPNPVIVRDPPTGGDWFTNSESRFWNEVSGSR